MIDALRAALLGLGTIFSLIGCDELKNTKFFHELTVSEWCETVSLDYGIRCLRARSTGGTGDDGLLRACLTGLRPNDSTHRKASEIDRCNAAIAAMACADPGVPVSMAAMPEACRLPPESATTTIAPDPVTAPRDASDGRPRSGSIQGPGSSSFSGTRR